MQRFLYLATIALLCSASPPPARAQNIIIAPGLIQVPYFRMEWLPSGSTHIQAPFVDLYTRPLCLSRNPCQSPLAADNSSAIDQPVASDAPMGQQLFAAGRELNRALAHFDTGNLWQNYLGLSIGGPLSQVPVDHRPGIYLYPVASQLDLGTVLDRFTTISQDNRFRIIASLPAFQKSHELLSAYLAERSNSPPSKAEELPPPKPMVPSVDDRPQPLDL